MIDHLNMNVQSNNNCINFKYFLRKCLRPQSYADDIVNVCYCYAKSLCVSRT